MPLENSVFALASVPPQPNISFALLLDIVDYIELGWVCTV